MGAGLSTNSETGKGRRGGPGPIDGHISNINLKTFVGAGLSTNSETGRGPAPGSGTRRADGLFCPKPNINVRKARGRLPRAFKPGNNQEREAPESL